MTISVFAFYIFATLAVLSGLVVVTARNPVHSVLALIMAFFNAGGLFLLLGAEFLAFILVIVYVGAVAVLFLFVVMMLNINFVELREGFTRYLPVGLVIGLVLFAELVLAFWAAAESNPQVVAKTYPIPPVVLTSNTHALGAILYTDYFYLFQAAGLILLVAMMGAIVLTLRTRQGVKRQSISEQITRTPKDTIEIRKVSKGSGV